MDQRYLLRYRQPLSGKDFLKFSSLSLSEQYSLSVIVLLFLALLCQTSTGKEKALSDLNVEISKYYGKVKQAEQAYSEFNEKTKGDIIVNRVSHDELLDNLLVATIVCQVNMRNMSLPSHLCSALHVLFCISRW